MILGGLPGAQMRTACLRGYSAPACIFPKKPLSLLYRKECTLRRVSSGHVLARRSRRAPAAQQLSALVTNPGLVGVPLGFGSMGLGGSISLSQTRVFRLFVSGYVISPVYWE